jgi:hypothetical protein
MGKLKLVIENLWGFLRACLDITSNYGYLCKVSFIVMEGKQVWIL